MLLGVTLLKKKYPVAKYLCVLLIVAGVALFMYKPKKAVGVEEHTVGYGELLLVRDPGGTGSLFQLSWPQSTPPPPGLHVLRELEMLRGPHFWSLPLAAWPLALPRPSWEV